MKNIFECPSCGGQARSLDTQPHVYVCPYCGNSYENPHGNHSSQTRKNFLLNADFGNPHLPGWEKVSLNNQTIVSGFPPQLHAHFPPSDRVHFILKSSGYFDDQDIRVNIIFLEGDIKYIRAGLCFRYQNNNGGYNVSISAQGTYLFGYYETPHDQGMVWKVIMDWQAHNALKPGLNQTNKLRVVAKENQFRIYLNGVLASSLKADHYKNGDIRLAAEPSETSAIKVAFSQLEIFEA